MQWTHRIFLTRAKLKLKPAGMNSNSLVSASQMKRFVMSVFLDDTKLGRFSQMNWWLLPAAALTRLPVEANRSCMYSRPPLTVVALTWLTELMSQHCKEQHIPKLQGQEILNEHAGLRALVRWLKVERTAFTPQRLLWGLVMTVEKSLQPPASFSSSPPPTADASLWRLLRFSWIHLQEYSKLKTFIANF